MINNVFSISTKVLESVNADWDNGSFCGYDIFCKDNSYFVVPAKLECVNNDFLQQLLKNLNDENRLAAEKKFYSNTHDFPHMIHLLFDEDDTQYSGRILLKPSSYIDKQLLCFIKTNQVVVNKCNFSSDSDIETFLSRIYDFCIQKDIVLMGRYIKDNIFLKLLKKSKGNLKICTCNPDCINRDQVKRSIGNRSFTIKKGNKVDHHQRMVKMKCIIIVCDNDFDQLTTSAVTWTLSASIDSQIYSSAEQDIACFK